MVDKPLPGCAEGCVLLLLDDSVDGIYEEGQVCCYDFKVNLFSFLLICSVLCMTVKSPWRSLAREISRKGLDDPQHHTFLSNLLPIN